MAKRNNKTRIYETAKVPSAGCRKHFAALGVSDAGAYREWCREQGFTSDIHKQGRARKEERSRAYQIQMRAQTARRVNRHLCDLGFPDIDSYRAWCRKQGFTECLDKDPERRRIERETRERQKAERALHAYHHPVKDASYWVEVILANSTTRVSLPMPWMRRTSDLYRLCCQFRGERSGRIYAELLRMAGQKTQLLQYDRGLPWLAASPTNNYARALQALANHHKHWIRPLDTWMPTDRRPYQQFTSLVRHLFAAYPVPLFMDRVWFDADGAQNERERNWYIHLGLGQNIRKVGIPVALTSMAAHHFLQAPVGFSLSDAFLWGQVRGIGGSVALARTICNGNSWKLYKDLPFWQTVFQWFVNHPEIELRHVVPIIDFIYHTRFVEREVVVESRQTQNEPEIGTENEDEPGCVTKNIGAQEPEFTMKGRTPAALLRRVEEWHKQMAQSKKTVAHDWNGLGLSPLLLEHYDPASDSSSLWRIEELTRSRELETEGNAMNNCVASYVDACLEGHSSIWSVRIQSLPGTECRSVMTVEIDPKERKIVQALGKCNTDPGYKSSSPRLNMANQILRRWAKQNGIVYDTR